MARVSGLMDSFVKQSNELEVLGISVGDWNWFLRIHSDQADPTEVRMQLFQQLEQRKKQLSAKKVERLKPLIQALVDAWDENDLG